MARHAQTDLPFWKRTTNTAEKAAKAVALKRIHVVGSGRHAIAWTRRDIRTIEAARDAIFGTDF